jgi:hypothetical protein
VVAGFRPAIHSLARDAQPQSPINVTKFNLAIALSLLQNLLLVPDARRNNRNNDISGVVYKVPIGTHLLAAHPQKTLYNYFQTSKALPLTTTHHTPDRFRQPHLP